MKIGLIGGGNISNTHARAAHAIAGVEIAAVYGANKNKVDQLSRDYGAKGYSDFEAFLAHPPMEMVIIGGPSGLHASQGIAAAHHGLHVLVEKPIDISTEHADALITECMRAKPKIPLLLCSNFPVVRWGCCRPRRPLIPDILVAWRLQALKVPSFLNTTAS